MPTSIKDMDIFRDRACLSLAEIKEYTKGALKPNQAHALESHLAACPLCNDAVEGYMAVPAFDLSSELGRTGRGSGHWTNGVVRGIVITGLGLSIGWLFWFVTRPSVVEHPTVQVAEHIVLYDPAEELVERNQEVEAAKELPLQEQVGHDESALILEPAINEKPVAIPKPNDDPQTNSNQEAEQNPIRETVPKVSVLQPQLADAESLRTKPRIQLKRLPVSDRQLMYLSNLKMVHPLELYNAYTFQPELGGTPASSSDIKPDDGGLLIAQYTYMQLATMGAAHFVESEHKESAKVWNLILSERPEDVNALFYLGLCYYNLGMFEKAMSHFELTRDHKIDTFKEESTWYHALSTEQVLGYDAALPLYQNIATYGGFYSDRAFEKGQ